MGLWDMESVKKIFRNIVVIKIQQSCMICAGGLSGIKEAIMRAGWNGEGRAKYYLIL
jgi:hypothetical protein